MPSKGRRPRQPALWFLLLLLSAATAPAQLNQNCTVSVLNRTVPVGADGRWVLPNVPANFGQVKARATCIQNGVTIFGESAFFTIPANGAVNLPEITLGNATQIPSSLAITPTTISLTTAGQTSQLTVTATYPNGTTKNVTAASTGTNYTISNPAIATITAGGLITAVSSGTVVIQANNDGATAIVSATVTIDGTTPGGIPLSWLSQYGLSATDPLVPMLDPDRDNLSNLQEFQNGTDPTNPDTDGDGLKDGDEITRQTSPLLPDTDGDLIPDGVEVQTGTNPRLNSSYDLKKATATSTVTPPTFTLQTSLANPVVSVQLKWEVKLIDGKTTLDLTADPRTTYSSSDLNICSFGGQPGRIYSGTAGNCTISLSNNTLPDKATGSVTGFNPIEVSTLNISGAVAVDVSGSYAYVATGNSGLTVVDVTDRTRPQIRGTLSGLGNIQHVRAVGQTVFLADANGFLRIVNAQNPASPALLGSLAITGSPAALAVHGTVVAVAAQAGGVSFVNITNPASPALLSRQSTPAAAVGVDFDAQSGLVAIAMGTGGLQLADISTPASPRLRGRLTGGDVRRVLLKLPAALLADAQRSITSVNVTNPDAPALSLSLPANIGGVPVDIAGIADVAMTADVSFGRAVPIINTSDPLQPASLGYWTLSTAGYSSSIALDLSFGYLIIPALNTLRILKYQDIVDTAGKPPTVQITFPTAATTLVREQTITMTVTATDDVAVASVNMLVNGQNIFTTATQPYQTLYTVPFSATTLTFSATATDFGSNLGVAPNVTVPVIADPLTTAVGRVVTQQGTPVSGAAVSALSIPGTTAADGTFRLTGLPTIRGNIVVTAVATVGGTLLGGASTPLPPVPGGTTNVGDIRIGPKPFITSITPPAVLAGTTATFTVTGTNLAASTFAFSPASISVTAATINQAGTSASLTASVAQTASGRVTVIATNPAGSSDSTPVVGFILNPPAFNNISVPGAEGTADPDADGLSNSQEITNGTDPLDRDTDADNWPDGLEVSLGSNPRSASSVPNPNNNSGYALSAIYSILNTRNPSIGTSGTQQFVSGATISILNTLNPSTGRPGSQQYVSSRTFSILNLLNPASTGSGTARYVSSRTFSVLNSVIGVPSVEDTIRGFSAVSLLIIDEASRVDDSIYHTVRPMMAASAATKSHPAFPATPECWLISTPYGCKGFFYEEWHRENADPPWSLFAVPAADCGRIDRKWLAEERATMPDPVFRQEYCCEFVKDGPNNSFFHWRELEAAWSDDVQPYFQSTPYNFPIWARSKGYL